MNAIGAVLHTRSCGEGNVFHGERATHGVCCVLAQHDTYITLHI
jgi:hypothetical protein